MSETTDLLKRLCTEHKLTQTEISRLTGIPQPRLSRWANGEVPDAADDALKLRSLSTKYRKRKPRVTDPDAAQAVKGA